MLTRSSAYPTAVVAVMALVVLAPLLTPVLQSLVPAANPFPAYATLLAARAFWEAAAATIAVAAATTAIALPLGTALALLVVRSDLPGRHWLEPAVLATVLVPTPAAAIGVLALGVPPGWPALIAVSGLAHVPYAYLFVAAALRSHNADAEEAARIAGASAWRIATGVSIPMEGRALAFAAVLVSALAIAQFGLPSVLGEPAGIRTLSTFLFALAQERATSPAIDVAAAATTMMLMLAPPVAGLWRLTTRPFARPDRLLALGRQPGATPLRLRNWRGLAAIAVALWIAVSLLLPLAGLVRLIPPAGFVVAPAAGVAVGNSLALGLFGGALAIAVYSFGADAILRLPARPRRYAFGLSLVPLAIPGLAVGLVALWLFTLTALPPSLVTAWLAFAVVFLPAGIALAAWSLQTVDPRLAEVARLAGANPRRAMLGTTLVLMRDRAIVGWLVMTVLFLRETAAGAFLLKSGVALVGPNVLTQWHADDAATAAAIAIIAVALIMLAATAAFALATRERAPVRG